jgi:hypothetical protein
MNTIDFIHERCELMPLWERATAGVQTLRDRSSTDLLYFDSVDISTQKFFDLIRAMLAFKGARDFASLVLRPDPFSYFHFHFGKYPGFIHRAEHTYVYFFVCWQWDPGGSPADCLWADSERYAVLPIPGDWFVYADRKWEMGVLSGPPDIISFARNFYPFFLDPGEGFKIVG